MNRGHIAKKCLKTVIILWVYCTLTSLAFASTPQTIRIGLESVYKNALSIYIASQNSLQVGYFNEGFFQSQGFLNTNAITITKDTEDYYFTGIPYHTLLEAQEAARLYGMGAAPAYSEPGIYYVYIGNDGPGLLAVPKSATRIAARSNQNDIVLISENNVMPLLFQGSENTYSFPVTQVGNSRKYRGAIGVVNGQTGGLTAVNTVDLEEYLYGVVPAEMPALWPIEALKTQAVAARSIAIFQYNRYLSQGYNLVDTTASQVYRGLSVEHPNSTQAVAQTRGEVIKYNNRVAEALYSSTSGGTTEDAKYVWGNDIPYLKSVIDRFETEPAQQPWIRTITLAELNTLLINQGIQIGQLQGVEITSRTPSGRVGVLTFIGSNGSHVIRNESVRTFFSGTRDGSLKSRLFSFSGFIGMPPASNPSSQTLSIISADQVVQKSTTAMSVMSASDIRQLPQNPIVQSAAEKREVATQIAGSSIYLPTTQVETVFGDLTVYGQGFGHGVGMSQSGAMGMAKAGYNYKEILQYYYNGVTVER